MAPGADRNVSCCIAQLREKREWLARGGETWGDSKERADAFDDLAGDGTGVPSGGAIATGFRQALRLVQHRKEQIFRLIGREDCHERRQNFVLRIMAMKYLVG